jgi:ribosomal protein S27E
VVFINVIGCDGLQFVRPLHTSCCRVLVMDKETVEVRATLFEWDCPECGEANRMFDYADTQTVECTSCFESFQSELLDF